MTLDDLLDFISSSERMEMSAVYQAAVRVVTFNLRPFLLPLLSCLSLAASAQTGDAALPAPSTESAATVELVEGDVRVFDTTKKMRRVNVADPVNEGESIVTGSDGEIHLHMLDGGTIAVRPNTKMRIAQYRAEGDDQDKGIIGLLAGSFRSITGWIGRYSPRGYVVRTPTGTIGVRGTDHEPLVIPPGSSEGEPGTYDKVNSGGTYIQTPSGRVDVPENRAAFVPHGAKAGGPTPRLLDAIPHLYKSTKNEHLLEHRHETTQRLLEKHREDRRKVILQRKASPDRLKPQTEGKQDALPHLGDKAANQTAEQRKGLSEEKREARQKANEQRKQAQEKRRSRQELAKQRAEERKKKNAERKDVRKVEKE